MVRIVSVDPSVHGIVKDASSVGFGWAAWASGPLARWLDREGYDLEPRDCGDGSWAVLARKPTSAPCVVATGFTDAALAAEWIRGELGLLPFQ